MTTQVPALSSRKMGLQALAGAVAGAVAMIGAMRLLEGEALAWQPSQIILAGIGMIYLLMGLFVGVGIAVPARVGQRLLNVADAEELVEERASMSGSALTCIAIGAILTLLAYSTVEGATTPVTATTAFWIMLALLVAGTLVSIAMWRRFDELWRQLTIDASAITGNMLLGVCVIWGGAAAAGLAPAPHPLDLISLAFGSFLLATFIAAGRRGRMTPQ